jgi:O-antigen ligase
MTTMLTDNATNQFPRHVIWIGLLAIVLGAAVGFLAGAKPLFLGLAIVAVGIIVAFFVRFELVLLGLLVLRSAIDCFVVLQLPVAFALGLDALAILYVVVQLLSRQTVRTDKWLYCFGGWLLVEGLWMILLWFGALGLDGAYLSDSLREWIRILSWVMVYFLILQLKGRMPPQQVITTLFWSLLVPLTVALIQMVAPAMLFGELSINGDSANTIAEEGSRIHGTMGHPNGLATHIFLFIGLTWWKLGQAKARLPWLLLLGVLVFFFVGTKALFSLIMLAVFFAVVLIPRLSLPNLFLTLVTFAIVIALFGSTEFGQARLGSISQTPLLNPDIDISRAILLQQGDNNSFNWRIAQWYMLLGHWQDYPILGHGLGLSVQVAGNGFLPHNDYIRFLVEGGIVGLATTLSLFVAQGVRLMQFMQSTAKNSAKHSLSLLMLAMLLAILAGMLTENIWGHTMLFFYWWTIFAVLGWDWDEVKPDVAVAAHSF